MGFRGSGRQPVSKAQADQTIDDLVDAYVSWREESLVVRETYDRYLRRHGREAAESFCGYLAALEREEHAAGVYARTIERAADCVLCCRPISENKLSLKLSDGLRLHVYCAAVRRRSLRQ